MKNLVLLGLPGCGKTTLGRAAAKKLGMGFLDLDALVETRAGKTITKIFEEGGEAAFRLKETEAVAIAAAQNGMVISTGGGVVERPENIELLRRSGILIFIDRPAQQIAQHMRTADRPMMEGKRQKLYELEARRRPLYSMAAHYILESGKNRRETEKKLCARCRHILSPAEYCVIGDPIGHSLSPEIHMPVLGKYLQAASYEKQLVTREQLPEFMRMARKKLAGFNATMPHKEALLPLLDEIDADARALGSVNTVVNRQGKLYGYSTDGAGFFAALKEKDIFPQGKQLTILGAGGAAAAVAVKAAALDAKVTVLARDMGKAQALAGRIQRAVPGALPQAARFEEIKKYAAKTDILINATPLGMAGTGTSFQDFDFLDALPRSAVVCDLIYKPRPTELLKAAFALGHPIMDGLPMLVYQALLADELYLGTQLDMSGEYHALEASLLIG